MCRRVSRPVLLFSLPGITGETTVYAGAGVGFPPHSDAGVFKTTDGGNTWSVIGLTDYVVTALAIDPIIPQTIYAGTFLGGGIYKSNDGGATWSAMGLNDHVATSLVIDPNAHQTIYASTYSFGGSGGGVFKSIDGGNTWSVTGLTYYAVYALAIDSTAPQKIYAGTVGDGVCVHSDSSTLNLALGAGGAANVSTTGGNQEVQVGYATIAVNSGATPYETAVFSYIQNRVTVSETAVAASPPTTQARIFIDYRSAADAVPGRSDAGEVDIDTGIAIVNYGSASANVTYTLRDINGVSLSSGHGTIAAGTHFAIFIDQLNDIAPDFNLPSGFATSSGFASLEIASDQSLSIVALRMITNQRNEILFTTTPTADLSQPLTTSPLYFAQLADGGGYTTTFILLNTSTGIETGTFQVLDDNGVPLIVNQVGGSAGSSFRYTIPSGGTFRFQTDGSPENVRTGWVRLTPDSGASTPVGSGLFSYNPDNVMIMESGMPAAIPTTHARIYVDLSGNHDTGLAIANVSATNAGITMNAFQSDGVTGVGTSNGPLQLPGNGHSAMFVDQFIAGLTSGFTGVLDISSTTPFAAFTVRSLYNERHDFLVTGFPIADANQIALTPIVFPQIADGGGCTTQIILLSPSGPSNATLSFYAEDGSSLDLGN